MDCTVPASNSKIKKHKSHKLKYFKSKQERLASIKHCKISIKKFKLIKKLYSQKFWILNPSNNITKIQKEISILRKKHGIETFNKYIKMYYYNCIKIV